MEFFSASDWRLIRWFKQADVPRWNELARDLLIGIDSMAAYLQASPVFISTKRTPEENARAGGAKDSEHLRGEAADIFFPGKTLGEMYAAAERASFGGIGVYPENNFVHVDVRSKIGRWSRIAGKYLGINAAWEFLSKKARSRS